MFLVKYFGLGSKVLSAKVSEMLVGIGHNHCLLYCTKLKCVVFILKCSSTVQTALKTFLAYLFIFMTCLLLQPKKGVKRKADTTTPGTLIEAGPCDLPYVPPASTPFPAKQPSRRESGRQIKKPTKELHDSQVQEEQNAEVRAPHVYSETKLYM